MATIQKLENRAVMESEPSDDPEALKRELAALRKAHARQEAQILSATRSMDAMLRQVEEQRNKLEDTNSRLSALNEFVNRVTDQMGDALILIGENGTIELVNRKLCSTLGYRIEDLKGKPVEVLLLDDEVKALSADLPELPWEITSVVYETVVRKGEYVGELHLKSSASDNELGYFLVHGTVIYSKQGKQEGVVLVASDIDDIKERQEALEVAQTKAEEATQAKSEFLANMSHELRTPLNAIIGFSDAIQEEIFGSLENKHYLDYIGHINKAGSHLLAIINDILDLSKIEAGKMELHLETQQLDQLTGSTVTLMAQQAEEKDITLIHAVPDNFPAVVLDSIRFKQVLINLMSNAIKFTGGGGEVALSVGLLGENCYEIIVEDNGIGIAATDIEKIMSPFGQVEAAHSRSIEGTGLGLPLTNRLIEMHGGHLFIESTPGVGTKVSVCLPLDPEADFSCGLRKNTALQSEKIAF